jgi:hypothetical protein
MFLLFSLVDRKRTLQIKTKKKKCGTNYKKENDSGAGASNVSKLHKSNLNRYIICIILSIQESQIIDIKVNDNNSHDDQKKNQYILFFLKKKMGNRLLVCNMILSTLPLEI